MHIRTHWLDEDERFWRSNRHLHRLPAAMNCCWFTCQCPRPEHKNRIAPIRLGPGTADIVELSTCAWSECGNPPRATSKYCSRNCSNKNARARARRRKSA